MMTNQMTCWLIRGHNDQLEDMMTNQRTWLTWRNLHLILFMSSLSYLVLYLSGKPSFTEPSSFTSSDVFLLYSPPMRYSPDAVAQDTWNSLPSLRLSDWRVQDPWLHLSQVVCMLLYNPPPQAKGPFWVCQTLPSGNSGREQLVLCEGR